MRHFLYALVAAAIALPGVAAAQTDFTADDGVNHFKPKTLPGGAKTKGVTFGPTGFGETKDGDKDAETGNKASKPAIADPGAFNLSITFEFNSDRLTGQAQRNLREFADALNRPTMESLRFAVEGHTDARGKDGYNQSLSERRAAAVVEFLESQGINRSRLQSRGYGESKPLTKNPRDAANRRVETRLIE